MGSNRSTRDPAIDVVVLRIRRSAGDHDSFQVRLERAGAPAVYASMRFSPTSFDLEVGQLRAHYERQTRSLRDLAALGMPAPPADERPLLDLGRRVTAVLPAGVRHAIAASVRGARRRMRALRLVLAIADDARALLALPWELMTLPAEGGPAQAGEDAFLLLHANITLVRQIEGAHPGPAPALDQPLRLLAVAAAPDRAQPLDAAATRQAIAGLAPAGALPRYYDGHDTLGALQEQLRHSSPQIVHVLCHGECYDVGWNAPRCALLFTRANGLIERVDGRDLARVLTLAYDLRLVVLQACHAGAPALSSQAGGRHLAESIAQTLVRSGVPAVVAMQGELRQETAATFVRACYEILARTSDVGLAVAAGRIAMRAAGDLADWSVPVVYQRMRPPRAPWYARLTDRLGWP